MNIENLIQKKKDDIINKANLPPEIVVKTNEMAAKFIDYDYYPDLAQLKYKGFRKHLEPFSHLNLYKHGWRTQFGSSKSWAGLCSPKGMTGVSAKGKNIYFSIDFIKYNKSWESECEETVKHEIAHALICEIFYFTNKKDILISIDPEHYANEGHGKLFHSVCEKIYGQPCSQFWKGSTEFSPESNDYRYVCVRCGTKKYGNNPNFASRCVKCGTVVLVEKNNK